MSGFGRNYRSTLYAKQLAHQDASDKLLQQQAAQEFDQQQRAQQAAYDNILGAMKFVQDRQEADRQAELKAREIEAKAAGTMGQPIPETPLPFSFGNRGDAGRQASFAAGQVEQLPRQLSAMKTQLASDRFQFDQNKFAAGAPKRELDVLKGQREIQPKLLGDMLRASTAAQRGNPDAFSYLQRLSSQVGMPAPRTPEDLPAFDAMLNSRLLEDKVLTSPADIYAGAMSQFDDVARGDVSAPEALAEAYRQHLAAKEKRAKIMAPNGLGLGTAATNQAQKDTLSALNIVANVQDIAGDIRKFLGYVPQIGAYMGGIAEKLPYGDKILQFSSKLADQDPNTHAQFLQDYTRFQSSTRMIQDAYRRIVTGAAASVPELQSIMSRLPGPEDGPNAFVGKLSAFHKDLANKIIVNQGALLGPTKVDDKGNIVNKTPEELSTAQALLNWAIENKNVNMADVVAGRRSMPANPLSGGGPVQPQAEPELGASDEALLQELMRMREGQ